MPRARRFGKGLHVLGKTGAPISRTGKQERRADALVAADAASDEIHVGAHLLTEIGDLVHERDARREHGIGGVFRHLRGRDVHEDDRPAGAHERRVELGHDASRLVCLRAQHHAVGFHEVIHRRAFFQKLGIAHHVKRMLRMLGDRRRDTGGRAHGHRRLCDDHDFPPQRLTDHLRDVEHVAQVGGPILVWRRADRDEDDIGFADRPRDVSGERQSALALVAFDVRLEARLEDRQLVLFEALDLLRIDISADHVVPGFG
jgi:hypothetical protein